MNGKQVAAFHDSRMSLIRQYAANKDTASLAMIGAELRTIATDESSAFPRNVAAGLLTYARTCYRNVKSASVMTTLPNQPLPSATLAPKRGYTIVHAHYRKVS